jgi:hypothetical protein
VRQARKEEGAHVQFRCTSLARSHAKDVVDLRSGLTATLWYREERHIRDEGEEWSRGRKGEGRTEGIEGIVSCEMMRNRKRKR